MSKEINKVIMHLKYLHDVQSWGICESEQDARDRRNITKEAIDFLKAQEPIEPIRNLGISRCGKCNREIDKYDGDRFCPSCGREVKWE